MTDDMRFFLKERTITEPTFVGSLEKVFPDDRVFEPLVGFSCLKNETYALQLVIPCSAGETPCGVRVCGLDGSRPDLYLVGTVPTDRPASERCSDDFLAHGGVPGDYPDVLRPCSDSFTLRGAGSQAVWIELAPAPEHRPGRRTLFFDLDVADRSYELNLDMNVIDAELPEGPVCTHWFHSDCLAEEYDAPVFSDKYWGIVESYLRCAVDHGINMILTPLFTPPLDTEVGSERLTVQLVDVTRDGDGYRFGFDRLGRWTDLCLACGAKYFELSHLFTQWGARHAPKIVSTGGELLFGWQTDASGAAYKDFLRALAPELTAFLKAKGVADRCYVHVSDEPSGDDIESYADKFTFLKSLFPGFHFIDALSDTAFLDRGLTDIPIPSISHARDFAGRVPELWTYYCGGPAGGYYINRFVYYPSVRNRALGAAMYRWGCEGFLHWGYNFWHSALSRERIDPYRDPTAGDSFPAGDGYVVYPGEDGRPVPSLRLKVFRDALTDFRALRTLELLVGRDEAVALVSDVDFNNYPRTAPAFAALRERINRAIRDAVQADGISV